MGVNYYQWEGTVEKLCSHFSSGFLSYHSVTKFEQPFHISVFVFRGLSHNIWKSEMNIAFCISPRRMKWAVCLRQEGDLVLLGSEAALFVTLRPFIFILLFCLFNFICVCFTAWHNFQLCQLCVFLLYAAEYFATTMVIVGLSVIATVLVLQYHHHDPDGGKMPKWVSVFVLHQ